MRLAIEAGAETIKAAQAIGAAGVPVDGGKVLDAGPDVVLAPLREAGLEACQINAFFFNPLDPNKAKRDAAVDRVERLIDLATQLGGAAIAFGAGSYASDLFGGFDRRNRSPEAITEAAEVLRPLARRALASGQVLTLEPHIRSVLHSPEVFAQLADAVGCAALRCTLDVTNFYDFGDFFDPRPVADRCGAALRGRVGAVHLKEVGPAPGFHLHAGLVPLDQGHTDWFHVLRTIAGLGVDDRWLLIEHCRDADEATRAAGMVRRIAAEAGVILT